MDYLKHIRQLAACYFYQGDLAVARSYWTLYLREMSRGVR